MNAQQVLAALQERQKTLVTAESCTGGLCAKRITDIPGASGVFLGGVVSYTDTVKQRQLGVQARTLEQFGAVSEEVAREMAVGARRLMGADFALSATGVAGPDTDERGNEIGTVFVALAAEDETVIKRLALLGDRSAIRQSSTDAMLALLWRYLQEQEESENG